MSNLILRFFAKAQSIDIEKLSLRAKLSEQSSRLDENLIGLAAFQNKLDLIQNHLNLTIGIDSSQQYSISNEVELLESYIATYKSVSKEEAFIFITNKLEPDSTLQVYPFILMPLIQNAIIYGYNMMEKYPIRVKINSSESTLKVEISNRVNHHIESQEMTSIIENLKARLALLYPEKHQLLINSNSNIFKATLLLR